MNHLPSIALAESVIPACAGPRPLGPRPSLPARPLPSVGSGRVARCLHGARRATALLLAAFVSGLLPVSAELPPLVLEIGFLRYAFSNVNRNDAEAAFKVFVATLARKRGYAAQSNVHVYDEASDFEPDIRAGKLQLAIIDAWRLLAMDIRPVVEPAFVTSHGAETGKRYLLLTRRDSGLDRLADLRGRDLAAVDITNASLGQYWLETLLVAENLGVPKSFFSRYEIVNKPSSAVLPVFFGRKPACVVDEVSFELLKELNPQVGNSLQVVRTSDPLVDGVLCVSRAGWASDQQRQDVLRALGELHAEPDGQQLLTLFKTGPLVPFSDAQLETVRRLRQSHAPRHPTTPVSRSRAAP